MLLDNTEKSSHNNCIISVTLSHNFAKFAACFWGMFVVPHQRITCVMPWSVLWCICPSACLSWGRGIMFWYTVSYFYDRFHTAAIFISYRLNFVYFSYVWMLLSFEPFVCSRLFCVCFYWQLLYLCYLSHVCAMTTAAFWIILSD